MHHCLRTPELLLNIFQYVREDLDPRGNPLNQATLAGLARTCRDFKEPALDMLWYSMDSFLPLLRCLPSECLDVRISRTRREGWVCEPYVKLTITNKLEGQHFTRMLHYTSRIKVLHLVDGYRRTGGNRLYEFVDRTACERLLDAKPFSGPLLPNVRHLTLDAQYFEGDPHPIPPLIFGSHLRRLHISGTYDIPPKFDWDGLSTLLTTTAAQVGMTDLAVHFRHWQENSPLCLDFPTAITDTLAASCRLSQLDLGDFLITQPGTVASLGLVPQLEMLTMNINLEELGTLPVAPSTHDGYFSSLRRLKLITTGSKLISDLVSQWRATRLESLYIERRSREFMWDMRELFTSFASHLPTETLYSLTLCNGVGPFYTAPYNDNTSDLTHDAIRHLFRFHGLEKLILGVGARNMLDDRHLPELASAWPKMRHLELDEREFSGLRAVTPAGLYAFITSMPSLRHLTLRFNASDPTTFPDLTTIRPHRLRYLDVCTSDADDKAPIALFLQRAFPMLETLHWGWVYENPRLPASIEAIWEARFEDEEQQIRNDDSHECWINTFETLMLFALPRLKR